MDVRRVRAYCSERLAAACEHPFGPGVRVYKVRGKVFALVPETAPWSVSLKCDPVLARILRENHRAITPGYHLNKAHWNTVALDGSVPASLVREMIAQSYELVVRGLSAEARLSLSAVTTSRSRSVAADNTRRAPRRPREVSP
jgi:predicted DNA-binding protein (MmcQ/YjbR family)